MEINYEEIKKHKLVIATPMYGGNVNANYLISLSSLAYQFGLREIEYNLTAIWNDALITRARNRLVYTFLESSADIFLFIDSDIGFHWEDVLKMMQMMIETDKKIICATYPKKQINWEKIEKAYKAGIISNPKDAISYSSSFVLNFKGGDNATIKFNLDEPLEVLESGTGFMMIHREVFEKFIEAYPEQWTIDPDTRDPLYYFFDCKINPETKFYLSEDYMFCQYADKIGYSTWVLPRVYLTHTGSYTFSGSFADTAALEYKLMTEQGDAK